MNMNTIHKKFDKPSACLLFLATLSAVLAIPANDKTGIIVASMFISSSFICMTVEGLKDFIAQQSKLKNTVE